MFTSNLLHLFKYRNNSMVWPSSGSTCHTKVIYSHNITVSLVKYNLKSTTFVYAINSVAGKIYTWFVCEIYIQTLLFQSKCLLLSPLDNHSLLLFLITLRVKVVGLWTWLINPFWSYVGPRPTVWFSSSAPMSEDIRHNFCCVCSPAVRACLTLFLV
jgi:hypothetical protein